MTGVACGCRPVRVDLCRILAPPCASLRPKIKRGKAAAVGALIPSSFVSFLYTRPYPPDTTKTPPPSSFAPFSSAALRNARFNSRAPPRLAEACSPSSTATAAPVTATRGATAVKAKARSASPFFPIVSRRFGPPVRFDGGCKRGGGGGIRCDSDLAAGVALISGTRG